MTRTRRLVLLLGSAAMFVNGSLPAAFASSGNDVCVSRMNGDARKVLDARAKADAGCIKDHPGTDVTACVGSADPKTQAKESRLSTHFGSTCGVAPTFGLPAGGAAAISAAAEGAATAVVHDLFGSSIAAGSGAVADCQERVVHRAGQLAVAIWNQFRSCKKTGLPGFADANALAAACLGGPGGQQPDAGTIAKRQGTLIKDVNKRCIGEVGGVVGAHFPGVCGGADNTQFAACVGRQVKCRLCMAIKAADGLPDASLNCDAFDDGIGNSSCGPPLPPTPTITPTQPTRTPTRTATMTHTATPPGPTPTIPSFCQSMVGLPPIAQVPVTLVPRGSSCGGPGLNPPPAAPLSGQVNDGSSTKIADLGLGCLDAGGIPPILLPGGTSRLNVVGTSLLPPSVTLAGSAGTGPNDCTLGAGPGRHCSNGAAGFDGTGSCSQDADCNGLVGSCNLDAHCFFGPPIPLVVGGLGTCVMNAFLTDLCGSATLAPASASFATALSARTYLGTTAQPCPLCTNNVCDSGKNANDACTAVAPFNTSSQCPPNDNVFLAALTVPIAELTTGTSTMSSSDGRFCPGQQVLGAFGLANAREITETGQALGIGTSLSMNLAATFCIPSAGGVIDIVGQLPGPGAIGVTGNIDLSGVLP